MSESKRDGARDERDHRRQDRRQESVIEVDRTVDERLGHDQERDVARRQDGADHGQRRRWRSPCPVIGDWACRALLVRAVADTASHARRQHRDEGNGAEAERDGLEHTPVE
jgi:hypothetical protein